MAFPPLAGMRLSQGWARRAALGTGGSGVKGGPGFLGSSSKELRSSAQGEVDHLAGTEPGRMTWVALSLLLTVLAQWVPRRQGTVPHAVSSRPTYMVPIGLPMLPGEACSVLPRARLSVCLP